MKTYSMKQTVHETNDVVFSLIKKQEKYYAEIACKSKNYRNITEEIDLNLFSAVDDYFDEHNDHDIGIIVAVTEQPCAIIVSAKVAALVGEWKFAESEDIDIYDGIRFPFKWVAIKEKESFVVVYSVTDTTPVGKVLNI